MVYLPNEILNIIFSYVERPKHAKMIKYLIEDCYEEDYNPYTAEKWYDNYCFEYSFYEWYYLYRRQQKLGGFSNIWYFLNRIVKIKTETNNIEYKVEKNTYKHTPKIVLVGHYKLVSSRYLL
jgi:hypothetical protein